MSHYSRRGFLHGFSGLLLLPLLQQQQADLILYNAKIWTVDPKQPRARREHTGC